LSDLTLQAECDAGDSATGGGYFVTGAIEYQRVYGDVTSADRHSVSVYNSNTSNSVWLVVHVVCADVTP
jgi:hypothetical protein